MSLRPLLVLLLLLPSLARAEQILGIGLYERGEYERARRVLVEEVVSPRLSEKERALARVYLAASLLALGKTAEARQQLEEVARRYPAQRVDPALFPPELVTQEEVARANVEAEHLRERLAEQERLAAQEAEQRKREQEAAKQAPPAQVAAPLRLRPEALGFIEGVQKRWGLGAGVTVGSGALEGSARALLGGSTVGIQLEGGWLFGGAAFQPRVGLRGTVVPGLEGQAAFGGGVVVGGRLALSPQLTALLDVGADAFAAPAGYQHLVVMASAGLGFNLLSP